MDQSQIILQTINDIDEFVAKFSDKINADDVDKIHEYKNQIKVAFDLGNLEDAQSFCVKAIGFMQDFEIGIINKKQDIEEKNMLNDLMFQTSGIATNSTIKDGKIIENKSIWIKNIYYKYFYKGEVGEGEFDDNKFILDFIDNVYQLLILIAIIMLLYAVLDNYFDTKLSNYYNIYTIGWFAFAIWFCKITKTSSNLSIILDIFILGCSAFGFWFVKLFFALG